ncbi:hypothetical protein HDU78_002428 [Chytriomyces hyalinus]|nr:hypothetical protein HDU78_002428 [Chytriomyces hyalinus]
MVHSNGPLAMATLVPIAALLNVQSLAVTPSAQTLFQQSLSAHSNALSSIALTCGVVATLADLLRMLEKKIKWTTRLIIAGAFFQGVLNIAVLAVYAFCLRMDSSESSLAPFSHPILFTLLSAATSLYASYLGYIQLQRNSTQVYIYTMSISADQRQLTILTILSFIYIVSAGAVYSILEDWDLNDSMYFVVVVLTTIGFGDLSPKTTFGKLAFPLFASIGIGLVGLNIYAVRQVLLEMFTIELANSFSKRFGMSQEHHHSSDEESSLEAGDEEVDGSEHPNTGRSTPSSIAVAIPRSRAHSFANEPLPCASSCPTRFNDSLDLMSESASQSNALASLTESSASDMDPLESFPPPINARRPSHSLYTRSGTPQLRPQPSRTLTLNRQGSHFPRLTLFSGDTRLRRGMVVTATKEIFLNQIGQAVTLVLATMVVFGCAFSYLEGWTYGDGIYFTFVTLTTIGFGDLSPKLPVTRSIFIWFVFAGITAVTYLGSMISERVLNQWTITVGMIQNRMGRYAVKAKLKRQWGNRGGIGSAHRLSGSSSGGIGEFGGIAALAPGIRSSSDESSQSTGRVVRIISPRSDRIGSIPGSGILSVGRRMRGGVGATTEEEHLLSDTDEDSEAEYREDDGIHARRTSSPVEISAERTSPIRPNSVNSTTLGSSSVRIFSARPRSSRGRNSFTVEDPVMG